MHIDQNSPTLVLMCRDLTGGIRKHVVSILCQYEAQPERVVIVTNLPLADLTFNLYLQATPRMRERILDVPMRRSPHPADLWQLFYLWRKLRRVQAGSVFHGHGAKGGLHARILGKWLGHKTLYTPHGGSIHQMHGWLKNRIFRFVERVLYYFSDQIIFESAYSRDTYAKHVMPGGKKFVLNYNGVDFTEAVAPEKNVATKPFIVGAFGALKWLKGYDVLLRAAGRLAREGHDIVVKIYGQGDQYENLLNLAEEQGLSSRAHIGLSTNDVLQAMRECHLVVQPSRFESFGYTALEAISVKVPVIAAAVGGLVEIVENGETGLTFQSEDDRELAEKILLIKNSPQYGQQLANQAYNRCREKFDEKRMVAKLAEIYGEGLR